jgi:hypothetical protein
MSLPKVAKYACVIYEFTRQSDYDFTSMLIHEDIGKKDLEYTYLNVTGQFIQ